MMMSNVIDFATGRPVGADQSIRRPSTLIRAARHGLSLWQRQRDLRRALKTDDLPVPGAALPRLMDEEGRLDHARRENDATYDLRRHILILVAILAERRDSQRAAESLPFIICPEKAILAHL